MNAFSEGFGLRDDLWQEDRKNKVQSVVRKVLMVIFTFPFSGLMKKWLRYVIGVSKRFFVKMAVWFFVVFLIVLLMVLFGGPELPGFDQFCGNIITSVF